MIIGQEYHSIIQNIFGDVRGLNESSQLQVNCPRCAELNGLTEGDGKFNLEINTKLKVFRCWKCDSPQFSGSLGRLVRTYGSHGDYEIYRSYAGSSNEYFDEEKEDVIVTLPAEMIPFSKMDVNNPSHLEAYNYLIIERKIDKSLIQKYRLGFCVTGKYANRIIIPSYDINGNVNYFSSRTYDPKVKKMKYLNPDADKNKFIFNEGMINWDSTVYLVEGVFDMFALYNAIPLLGKYITHAICMKLKETLPEVVIVLDPDAFGKAIEIYYTLESIYAGVEHKVKIVKLINNDDIDELRLNFGVDAVKDAIYGARDLIVGDYFEKKLNKYGVKQRYDANSKYFEWKSGSTKNIL